MHSILVIGCGSIGERHLRSFQATGRANVTACDTSVALLETIAANYQVKTLTDWHEGVNEASVDAVIICAPADHHLPMAIAALKKGKHVLIEKPLSTAISGVKELLRIRESSGRKAFVAYTLHVYDLMEEARNYLLKMELGPIKEVSSLSGQNFPMLRPAHAVSYARTYYRDRKTGGGAIQDALTHTVNWVESVVGPTTSLTCDCAHLVLPDVEVEDTVHVTARNDGVLVNYSLNQFQAPNEAFLQFNAVGGSVRIEFHNSRWGIFRQGAEGWAWNPVSVKPRDTHFIVQANRFMDLMEGKLARLCTVEAALDTLRFNLAALRSADTGGARVHCRDITE